MQKRLTALIAIPLVALAAWLGTQKGIAQDPFPSVTLMWDYPELTPEIVFNVYQSTSLQVPMENWELVHTTAETKCVIPATAGAQFFTVTASNIVTGVESGFATK